MVGVFTAAGVYLIYNNAVPSIADVRSAPSYDLDAETARKHAAIVSALLVGTVFLVARDLNSYIISGAALFAIDAMHKHAGAVNPGTGKIDSVAGANNISSVHPLPTYEESAA
jgi:hypothetical protein